MLIGVSKVSIKCKNHYCNYNNDGNCTNEIEGLSFDVRGRCESFCSELNCIVCNEQINYRNSTKTNIANLCDKCNELMEDGDIKIFYKDDLIKYKLQRAKVGKVILFNKREWKVIKIAENKSYKILELIRFGSQI